MKRIDRYLLKEMIVPALVGVVMLLVLLVGNVLYMLLNMIYGGAPLHTVGKVLLLSLPTVLLQAVPGALLLGTALSLNRLERDRELLALRMSGLRLSRLVLPYLVVGIIFSGLILALQEKVVPQTTHAAQKLIMKLSWATPGSVVHADQVFTVGRDFYYVRNVDPNTQTLHNIVVCKMGDGYPTWMVIPQAVNHNGQWFVEPDPVTGQKPRIYTFYPNGELAPFVEAAGPGWINLSEDMSRYMTDTITKPEELTYKELHMLQQGVRGLNIGLYLAPAQLTYFLHRKLALPLSALVAVLLAIPLSVRYGRSGGYVGLLLSVVVAFCFIVAQQWTQVLAVRNLMDPVLAAWAPNAVFGTLGAVLLMLQE